VHPAQIITTVGATQALDIVSRTLLKAGDPVMVESPAGRWSLRGSMPWACACCPCRAAPRAPTWR
jgi:hypothetical protein